MYSLALAALLLTACVACLAVALRCVAGWRAGARPSLLACAATVAGGFAVAVLFWWLGQSRLADDDDIGAPIVVFVTVWGCALPPLFVLGDRKIGRTVVRWLGFGVAVLVAGLVEGLVIDPFVVVTARPMLAPAMPPTVRADHSVQPCPECGGELVVTLFPIRGSDGVVRHNERFRRTGVCAQCLRSENPATHVGPFYGKDHFTVNRLRSPDRWRVVAFARGRSTFPTVRRVVGLPGETVFLRDGAVWVNGARQEPPPDIVPVRYSETLPQRLLDADPLLNRPARAHGYAHPDEPLVLKSDEYFLLNDDPDQLHDGRDTGPARGSDYLGVVEAVFWPPRRWGLVR